MHCNSNPICLRYAMRASTSAVRIPNDNEVVYGKIDGMGHLLHESELPVAEAAK